MPVENNSTSSKDFQERSSRVREAAADRGFFANLLPDGRVQVTGTGARTLVALGARPSIFKGSLFEAESTFWSAMEKTPVRFFDRG